MKTVRFNQVAPEAPEHCGEGLATSCASTLTRILSAPESARHQRAATRCMNRLAGRFGGQKRKNPASARDAWEKRSHYQ